MYKKIIINIIFLFFFTTLLSADQTITIESTGISVIKGDVGSSRQNALNDAFKKAIKKVLKEVLNISDSESIGPIISSPTKFINGYEIVEEKQIGNILNEKIKSIVNLALIEKIVNKKSSSKLIYIAVFCSKENSNFEIDTKCSNFIKNSIKNIPNTIFLPYQNNLNDSLAEIKDLLILVKYNLFQEKKVFSISMEFDNLTIDLKCLDSKSQELFSKHYQLKILKKFDESVFDKIDSPVNESIKNLLTNVVEKLQKEYQTESQAFEYYLVVKSPNTYYNIKNVTDLLDKFNINYTLEKIENRRFVYVIKGKSKEEVLKIFRFANFKFKYIKADKDIIVEF